MMTLASKTTFAAAVAVMVGGSLATQKDTAADQERTSSVGYEQTNSLGMQLAAIPAGAFSMGSPVDEPGRLPNEGPVHRVEISQPFWMGTHEVTRGQFGQFVEQSGYVTEAERDEDGGFGVDFDTAEVRRFRGLSWRDPGFPRFLPDDRHPVSLVSWNDAEAFCRWLSAREGRSYRLPTEAEWEYAARGGVQTAYSHGDSARGLGRFANVADRGLRRAVPAADWTEGWSDGHPFTAPVGSYEPNGFGLYDMHGNVWEWCADWHSGDYYAASPPRDPTGPPAGKFRVIRGGGWLNPARQNRSAQRIYFDPEFRYCLLSGFRVVMEASS